MAKSDWGAYVARGSALKPAARSRVSAEPSSDVIAAMRSYGGGAHYLINQHLRTGSDVRDEFKQEAKLLNEYIKTQGLSTDKTLYRGLKGVSSTSFKVGRVVKDDGIGSLSEDESAAAWRFTTKGSVLLKLSVPKGYPAADISKHVTYTDEKEYLIPSGWKFRVTKVRKHKRPHTNEAITMVEGVMLPYGK